MPDIFISYSSRDREQARALVKQLRSHGYSLWIDESGIEAAASWSKEIAGALENCKVMALLLSPASVASQNVAKELTAAIELKKPVLPIELEPVALKGEFLYHLSGVQRIGVGELDSVLRALAKFGVSKGSVEESSHSERTSKPSIPNKSSRGREKWIAGAAILFLALAVAAYFLFFSKKQTAATTDVKTIAVLPFESLSTEKESEYFAEGMTETLIDMLLPIPQLKVIDRMSVMGYKGGKRDLKSIAAELGVRYLVDGTIEKQANAIKISIHLNDTRTDSILLSKSFEGNTNDLMTMQEKVARAVVYELQLAFNPDGVVMPPEAMTNVPEAYNLGAMGSALQTSTPDNFKLAISYYLRAAKLDPGYAYAYLNIARDYGNLYAWYHTDSILSLADSFFVIGKRLDTAGILTHFVASWLASQHKDYETAIQEAKNYLQKRPDDGRGYRALALAYDNNGRHDLAVTYWQEDLKRNPLALSEMNSIFTDLVLINDTVALNKFITQALPVYEAALIKNPDRRDLEYYYIFMLSRSGRGDEACRRMDNYIKPPFDTPGDIEDAVEVFAMNGKTVHAMDLLRSVINRINIADTAKFNLTEKELANLRPLPEFQVLVKKQKEAVAKKNAH